MILIPRLPGLGGHDVDGKALSWGASRGRWTLDMTKQQHQLEVSQPPPPSPPKPPLQVWLNHHWGDPALINVREFMCRNGTANAQCAVPIAGFPNGSPELWCEAEYDSTECEEIKEEVDRQVLLLPGGCW